MFQGDSSAGVPLTLTCAVNTSSLELVDYDYPIDSFWLQDGGPIDLTESGVTENFTRISSRLYNNVLSYYPVVVEDSGQYNCTVRIGTDGDYIQSSTSSALLTVVVNGKIKHMYIIIVLIVIDIPPLNVTITSIGSQAFNSSYTLMCGIQLVTGFISLPSIQWRKGSTIVQSSVNDSDGMLSLSFSSLTASDAGWYTCSVELVVSEIQFNMSSTRSHNITFQSNYIIFVHLYNVL